MTKNKTITLTSNGRTGPEWIAWFKKNSYKVSSYAKDLLNSKDFIPTKGVEYEIAIIKGDEVSEPRTTSMIRDMAKSRGYETPPVEVGCLLREKLTDDEIKNMGLWYIVTMHEPIKDSDGDPSLLYADRGGVGRWLDAAYVVPDDRWGLENGFAFVVPQVSAQKSDTQSSSPVSLELAIKMAKEAGYTIFKPV